MLTSLMNSLVKEQSNKLEDQIFYTLRQLQSIDFFGFMHSARKVLQKRRLPFFKYRDETHIINLLNIHKEIVFKKNRMKPK